MKLYTYLIYGFGLSGEWAYKFLKKKQDYRFFIFEKKEEKRHYILDLIKDEKNSFLLNEINEEIVLNCDAIVLSPGISVYDKWVVLAKKNGKEVLSELEIGFKNCKNKVVAITGTNGKTTVVRLLTEILNCAGKNAISVGNIGYPLCEARLFYGRKKIFVCEVSSFQLEAINNFKPSIACILNITPDHINRHKNFKNYREAKFNIFKNLSRRNNLILNYNLKHDVNKYLIKTKGEIKLKVLNNDLNLGRKFAYRDNKKVFDKTIKNNKKNNYKNITIKNCKKNIVYNNAFKTYYFNIDEIVDYGCFVSNGLILFKNRHGRKIKVCKLSDFTLIGKHNLENVLACVSISKIMGIKNKFIVKALSEFKLNGHRLQKVYNFKGVDFFDDSKATNLDATICAINSMTKRTVLILGGSDKGYEYDLIFKNLNNNIIKILCCGEVKEKIFQSAKKFDIDVLRFENLRETVKFCCDFKNFDNVECILLSPASASFDEFSGYEERGDKFLEYVKEFSKN